MFVSIHTEAVLGAVVTLKGTIGIRPCKRTHIIAVMQKPLIFTERVDNLVKLRLKLVRFPLLSGVKPSSIKAIARGGKITTQMPDAACLPLKLHTLGIGVFLFGLCQSSYLHQRSSLSFAFFSFSCALMRPRASFAHSGVHSGLISPRTSYLSHLRCSPVARQVPNTA